MSHIFFEITIVLILATVLGMAAQALKQPSILGYIATGLIVGPLGLVALDNVEVIDAMAQFGIAFLLFLVGMEMNFRELRHLGRPIILVGVGQIVFTTVLGFVIARLIGFGTVAAGYLGVTLAFSSTIIVVKLLSEKRALESLHGKLIVGVLLAQDFVALGVLILLSGLSHAGPGLESLPIAALVNTFAKGTLLLLGAMAVGKWVMPRFLHRIAASQEMLFLASLAWGLGVAAFASLPQVGLTIEIGSFLAGIALAEAVEHFQISSRVKSMRDFFVVMFFIVLGSKMVLSDLSAIWLPVALLSLFVLVGNPLIVMLIMGALGYRSRTSFLAGVTVAQISEFSLVVAALAERVGHIDRSVVSIITAVGIVTITISSYMIIYSDGLYRLLKRGLKAFEFRKGAAEAAEAPRGLKGHVVLVGCHRMGQNILESLEDMHKEFMVVDFNPDVVRRLRKRGVPALYGDIADPDIQELSGIETARLVISTVPAADDSLKLLHGVRRLNPKAKMIMTAEREHDAVRLYEAGADYVLLPHFIGGLQVANLIREDRPMRSLARMRERDLEAIVARP